MTKVVNLHKHKFFEGTMKIQDEIENAWASGITSLTFIHGHNNGTAFRNYIRNGDMKKKANPNVRDSIVIHHIDKGNTEIVFNLDD